MPTETEIKLRLEDSQALRERLRQAGAVSLGVVFERNWILDAADGSLRQRGSALRVRTEQQTDTGGAPRVTLTYKGPRQKDHAASGLKIREEIETVATDEPALRAILSRLGFRPLLCYEKRRETWKLAGCLVTIDELPKLGWFAEIEGPDVAAVHNAQTLAGLDSASPIAESYPEMTRLHGVVMDDGSRALRFAE